MKKIINIFKADLYDIIKNPAFLVIVLGLLLLPSLYAWFNIKASWDPYGNTRNLQVGIVNEDKGFENGGKDVCLGKEIIEELHKNKDLGWQFLTKEKALKGMESGELYATIMIPANFSEHMFSILTENIQKPTLTYYVNEKINPVAPKITGKGATALQEEITANFLSTASEKLLTVFKEIGISINENIPFIEKVVFTTQSLDKRFPEIERILQKAVDSSQEAINVVNKLQDNLGSVENTITKGENVAEKATEFISNLQTQLNNLAPIVKRDLQLMNNVTNTIVNTIDHAKNQSGGNALSPEWIANLKKQIETSVQHATVVRNLLQSLQINALNGPISTLSSFISKANAMLPLLSDPNKAAASIQSLYVLAKDMQQFSNSVLASFDNTIAPNITTFINSVKDVLSNASQNLEGIKKQLPTIDTILKNANKGAHIGNQSLKDIQSTLPELREKIHSMAVSMQNFKNEEDLKRISKLLITDVVKAQDFISHPVKLEEHRMYPIPNYGTSMSPFYTTLSLWVGGIILISILSVGFKEEHIFEHFTNREIYFGRIMIFLMLGVIQALIVSLGDLFVLKIYAKESILFILSSMLISFVFVTVIYTLVSLFANIGKALSVVLLVFQIAASGGVFPVQVSPHFFQIINPFLPFTYANGLLREAVGGVYAPSMYRDITVLLFIFLLFIIIGVFLKKPCNNLIYRGKLAARKSRLMH